MDARAEQLVLDYLRRLEDAARGRLGPAERVAFMARSRAAMARQIGETRAAEADDVRRLLHRFGDPYELAAQERQRLDRLGRPVPAAQNSTAQDDTAQDDAHDGTVHDGTAHDDFGHDGAGHDGLGHDGAGRDGAGRDGAGRDGSRQNGSRPWTADAPSGAAEVPGAARPANPAGPAPSRWLRGRPATADPGRPSLPDPGPPPVPDPGRPPAPDPGRPAAADPGRPAAADPERRPGAAPGLHRPMTARWRPGVRPGQTAVPDGAVEPAPGLRLGSRWARPAPAGPAGPAGAVDVPGTGRDDGQAPAGDWDPAGGEPGTAGPGWLGGLLAVVRRHPLECVAIVLIGLGGLIDPWPLWPVGALAMFAAPLWSVRDKLTAVAIPLGFALVGAITLAGFSAHPPGLSGYAHEVHVEGWSLLRAGAVLGAAYLARRVQRGRRPRREPPWRRVPPAGR